MQGTFFAPVTGMQRQSSKLTPKPNQGHRGTFYLAFVLAVDVCC